MGRGMQLKQRIVEKPNRARKGTEVGMFLGSDGGVFGVGAPEVVRKSYSCINIFYLSAWIVFLIIYNLLLSHQRQQFY